MKYSHNIFHDKQTMFCKWPEEAAIKQLIWEKAHTLRQPNYLLTYLLFPLHAMVIHHVLPTILFGSGAESGWVGSHASVVPPSPLVGGCAVT